VDNADRRRRAEGEIRNRQERIVLVGCRMVPDGKTVAYVRQVKGPGQTPGVLETRNLENGEIRALLADVSLVGGGESEGP
jgi:hypothetical protein